MSSESDSEDQSEDYEIINLQAKNFVLFINDRGDAMHFLLQLRSRDDERRICTLIQKHFGSVAESRQEFGPHTIVLVDDNVLNWYHDGDVFKVSYIEECIAKGIVLDVSQFLKDHSREFIPNFNFMEIVYYKKYSWKTVPPNYRLKKESDSDSDTDTVCKQRTPRGLPYTRGEKESILKYVLKHHSTTGYNKLKGVSLWQAMEREKICDRTWQSMKEHFLKILMRDLSSFKCISQEEKRHLQNSLK